MRTHAPQYTIRGIPLEVDQVLRDRAKQRKVSLNQVIVDELTKATVGTKRFADFSGFVGPWASDPDFDETIESQRQIHVDDWR